MSARVRTNSRSLSLFFQRPLRIVLAGFSAITSACGVAAKEHHMSPFQACKLAITSPNKDERLRGLEALASGAISDSYSYKYNLTEVARISPYPDSRLNAVERINDPEQLHSIIVISDYEDSAAAAFERLLRLVKDGKADKWLLINSTNSRHFDISLKAITELDESGLFQAFRGSDKPLVRRIIVEKLASIVKDLKDPDAILTVALYAVDEHPRDVARRMLAGDENRSRIIRESSG